MATRAIRIMSNSDDDQAATSAAERAAWLKKLKNKRAQIKGQCTRFRTHLDDLTVRNVSVMELRYRLQKFTENWKAFNSIQTNIEELEAGSEFTENHNEERDVFEKRYFETASELECLIESKSPRPDNQAVRNLREGTPATQVSMVPNEHLRLPRVDLPSFSGSFDEWIPFRNMFLSMIDQNAALPNVQKMQYLLSALKGEARDIVSALETSDNNYNEAWDMLRDRYDDCSLIVQKHVKALFELPVIHKENHIALRRMIDSTLKHFRALKALQRPTEHWDDLIVHIVASRLDQKTNRAWEATLKKGDMPPSNYWIS